MKIWDKIQASRAKNKADRETREIEQAESGLIAAKREEEVETKKLALAEEQEKVSKLKSERFSHSTVGRAISTVKTAMTAQKTAQPNQQPQQRSGLFGGSMGQGGMGGGFSGFGMGSPPQENYAQNRPRTPPQATQQYNSGLNPNAMSWGSTARTPRKVARAIRVTRKARTQPQEAIDWGWNMGSSKSKKGKSPIAVRW